MALIYTYFALNIGLVLFFYKTADEEIKNREDDLEPRLVTYVFLLLFWSVILFIALLVKIYYYVKAIYDKYFR